MTTSIVELGEEQYREILKKLRFYSCAECGAELMLGHDKEGNSAFACTRNWKHTGVMREQSPYEAKGDESLNIPTRREKMVEQFGEEKTKALAKFEGVTSLTKQDANEILTTIYPNAPRTEIQRAILLCYGYNLNPLMGHVFLIPFKGRDGKQTFATVMGIKANRLIAFRRGAYSYLDNTPRLMTEDEQKSIWGKVQEGFICAITKLKDPATGAEAPGYGKWKESESVYGTDKGNSAENMAFIRSERQALDRLRPGEMPMNVEVVDERFMSKGGNGEAQDEADIVDGEVTEVKEENPPTKPKKQPPAKAQPATEPAESPFPDEPSKMTQGEFLEWANGRDWSSHDIIELCKAEFNTELVYWKDLTPELMDKVVKHIEANPKK